MSEQPYPEAMMGLNAGVVEEFRTNGGKVGGQFQSFTLLLTTTGAKSGQPRLSPLAYHTVDDKMLIIGSSTAPAGTASRPPPATASPPTSSAAASAAWTATTASNSDRPRVGRQLGSVQSAPYVWPPLRSTTIRCTTPG
jgi:F420H(2)-dependent quinone reductase